MEILFLTGMSGAGKSAAVRYLEDCGYFCMDNVPPYVLPDLVKSFFKGRNGEGFINRATEDVQIMHAYMESDAPDYEYILSNAKDMGYNFIVNKDSRPIDESLSVKYGYGLIASTDGYNIYYNPSVTEE